MNPIELSAEKIINTYYRLFVQQGINVSPVSKSAYNYEVTVSRSNEKLKIQVYFGKRGNKVILQGNKESKLYQKVSEIVFGPKLFDANDELSEPENYIGTDESGKGDYFGPLVIAGVFADKNMISLLKKAGVRDSKELGDSAIKKIAYEIKEIVGNGYDIIMISPEKYNELYEKFRNVNRLLGWAHAKVLENILLNYNAAEAISDKFGDESYIRNSLQEKGKNILLHQITKAEKYTAVAAASILARDKFNDWFEKKNRELKIQLPKGASSGVEQTAASVKKIFGGEIMNKLVKLHFKTTQKIL